MPEQYPYRQPTEHDPLPFSVDEWDERDNFSCCLGKANSVSLGLALYWAAVAKSHGTRRITLRHGIRVIEKTDDRKPID